MRIVKLPTYYYQQFDADFNFDVPAEGFGGWEKAELKLNLDKTALVVMHAWDFGKREEYPGWHRVVEYIPRANRIGRQVFPQLLGAARLYGIKVYHVVAEGSYYKKYPGYTKRKALENGNYETEEIIESDAVLDELHKFKHEFSYPGSHNLKDIKHGYYNMDFMMEARPVGDEGIVDNSNALFELCKIDGINHLIYVGFALDGCLLMSPGGMIDMQRRGFMCSVLRQGVTAIENRETARQEMCKEIALWRVALLFGFVYDVDDFVKAIIDEK